MSNLVGGKSQFAMNSYPQLYMLYLYIHVYSYIYYTFIGINNHPKRMFSIMCSTKERNRKTKVRQSSLIIVSDFKVEKHTSMVQNVTDWRRFISMPNILKKKWMTLSSPMRGQHLWPQRRRSTITQNKRGLYSYRLSSPINWATGLMCVIGLRIGLRLL